MKLMDKIYDLVLYNYRVKKIAFKILSSKFANNPMYNFFYDRRVKKRMKLFESLPFRVMIENTNICDADCVFCPHKIMKRKQGIMKNSLFKKIVDECSQLGIDYFTIYGFGEPLLDSNFFKKIKYAKSMGLKRVTTNTNAHHFTKEKIRQLLNSGLDEIYISVDAASEKIYKKLRPNLNFDKVENNIIKLIEMRNQSETKKPKIILSYVESGINKNETSDFINKWKNVVDEISISQIHNWTGDINHGRKSGFLRRKDPCRLIWTDMVISWDGKVPLCCNDYENKIIMGDVNVQPIKDIWKGKKLSVLRDFHKKKKFGKIEICKSCEYNYHDKSNWWVSK